MARLYISIFSNCDGVVKKDDSAVINGGSALEESF